MSNQSYQQLGDYRLDRLLGEGTFGEVYLSEHPFEKRPVVVKVLKVRLTPETIKLFLAEARVIRLRHPHILQLLDFDVDKDVPFLVMEYAPYGTLHQRHSQGTRVPLPTVCSYVKQIAGALQYAHERKLIHRDIKPQNMLIGSEQQILVSDFGIAVVAHSEQSLVTQTMAGTVPYMAPEQLRGKPRPASDQYALGVMVYEWLCGVRPFGGSHWEIVGQHLASPPPPLSEKDPTIPSAVEAVVMKALSKNPHDRFTDIRMFALALEQAANQQATAITIPPEEIMSPSSNRVSSENPQGVAASSFHAPSAIPTDTAPPESIQVKDATAPHPSSAAMPPTPKLIMPFSVSEHRMSPSSFQIPEVSRTLEARIDPGQSQKQPIISSGKAHLEEQRSSFLKKRLSRRVVVGGGIALLMTGGGLAWWIETRALPIGTLLYTYRGHTDIVEAVAWSPDGECIASASDDETVRVWNVADGSHLYTYRGHFEAVNAVAWSPDGKHIASASDATVQVWNAADGRHLFTYQSSSDAALMGVAWSYDSKRIASGTSNGTVQVWNVDDGGQALPYGGPPIAEGCAVAWSRDGKRIASASNDATVQVWNAANGSQSYTYRGHSNIVNTVAWSRDGKRIASASNDATVQVWNAANGSQSYTYRGHGSSVYAASWSPDGKRIASASDDFTVQVWNAVDGSQPYIYKGHSNSVNTVAWSPNGKYIASGGWDHTVQIWAS